MNERLTECPICRGKQFDLFLKCRDYTVSNEIFEIVSCHACDFKFTNPRPDSGSIGKYYESQEYVSHSNTTAGFINKLYHIIKGRAIKNKIRLVEDLEPQNKKILDIGCGTGSFLGAIKNVGWNVTGIEPNSKARKTAIDDFGIRVLEGLNQIPQEKFSVITMWHVLEHVHGLQAQVKKINALLEPKGLAIIAVPNYISWDAIHYQSGWAAYDVPRHLYHFSPKAIKSLFSENGFEHIQSKPMKFDSFYVSLLSEKYKGSIFGPIKAFINGLHSNIKASGNAENYSSVIYIFRKR